jgi:hypothetical protein
MEDTADLEQEQAPELLLLERETRKSTRILETWDMSEPFDSLSLSKAILGLSPDTEDQLSTLQDQLRKIVEEGGLDEQAKESELKSILMKQDKTFMRETLRKVLNLVGYRVPEEPNINHIAFHLIEKYLDEKLSKEKSDNDSEKKRAAELGSFLQQLLVNSFLRLSPEQFADKISKLKFVFDLMVPLLTEKDNLTGYFNRHLRGAAATAIALARSKEYCENHLKISVGGVFPTDKDVDVVYKVDGLIITSDNLYAGFVQSKSKPRKNPETSDSQKQEQSWLQETFEFDAKRNFHLVFIPIKEGSSLEQSEGGKDLSEFIKGASEMTNKSEWKHLIRENFMLFYCITNFKGVIKDMDSGQYPPQDFARDIAEFVHANYQT